jgi:hypothetical protein
MNRGPMSPHSRVSVWDSAPDHRIAGLYLAGGRFTRVVLSKWDHGGGSRRFLAGCTSNGSKAT